MKVFNHVSVRRSLLCMAIGQINIHITIGRGTPSALACLTAYFGLLMLL